MDRLMRAACLAVALLISACSGGNGTVGTSAAASVDGVPTVHAVSPQTSYRCSVPPATGHPSVSDRSVLRRLHGRHAEHSARECAAIRRANQAAVNALDGFSTTAVIRARFGGALNPASFNAQSVIVLQVTIDNVTKATTGVVQPLVFGIDYTVGLGTESGMGNTDPGNPANTSARPQQRRNQQRLPGVSDQGHNRRQWSCNNPRQGLRQHPGRAAHLFSHY